MSKIYSPAAEKGQAFVRHFYGRTFNVNAVAKIMAPMDTWAWEVGSGILWEEGAGLIVYSLRRTFITPSEWNLLHVTNPGLKVIIFDSHLSKLMMDPTISWTDRSCFSNCLRRRTSHQSRENRRSAKILIPAHRPTYLQTKRARFNRHPGLQRPANFEVRFLTCI